MENMKILIDADGCPVVNLTIEIAKKYEIVCVILCDTSHIFESDYAEVKVCSRGADSVDFALVNLVLPNDIVVTQDYGLAAMCLAKKALPINQNGMMYDDKNIDSLLMQRHTAKKIRRGGGRLIGPAKRTDEQNIAFKKNLENLVLKTFSRADS